MKHLKLLFFLVLLTAAYSSGPPITFPESKRLLLLDGDEGTVACRIYGTLLSGTIPRFSNNGTLESATRSLLRMKNLTAVRGIPGASMVGPIDYFGNLENPHQYLYKIENNFPPIFYRQPISENQTNELSHLNPLDPHFMTTIKANWVRGKDYDTIQEKQEHYRVTKKHLRQSLFLEPGLLEVEQEHIELQWFDPRDVDLSSFKARLINNQTPFQITEKPLPSKDEYRLITYLYEPLYADWQAKNGSGHFLEKHQFSQTMTPLTPDSVGYVVLASTNEAPEELELIGIQIPYGYTLIIEDGCIHGDTTLNGLFMMGMTSDHTTMRTADTVFLKYPKNRENVKITMIGQDDTPITDHSFNVPPPYVIYKGATQADRNNFYKLTAGQSFIFQPFSREYWQ